jgi:hypothetical protein
MIFRLLQWLSMSPALDPDNPVFSMAVRRFRWWHGGGSGIRYAVSVSAITLAILTVLYCALVVIRYAVYLNDLVNSPLSAQEWEVSQFVLQVLVWVGGIALGAGYLWDIFYVAFSLNSFNALEWPLVQVTPQPLNHTISALDNANQRRVWRMTWVLAATRLMVILAFLATFFVVDSLITQTNNIADVWDALWDDPIEVLSVITIFAILFAGYVLELFWRMRTTAALGLAVSAGFRQVITAIPVAYGLLIVVWVGLIASNGILWWIIIRWISGNYPEGS